MLKNFLLVGAGGFLGSVARYGVSLLCSRWLPKSFPYGTFAVNMAGCFIIGLLAGYVTYKENLSGGMWLLLATGFCGGFTTFSSFALENNWLLQDKMNITAMIYIALSLLFGLLLCRWGMIMWR